MIFLEIIYCTKFIYLTNLEQIIFENFLMTKTSYCLLRLDQNYECLVRLKETT